MKKETAFERLNKVAENTTKFRNIKGTKAWHLIQTALFTKNATIRPCTVSGKGRFATNMDYTSDVCVILDEAKIRYNKGNDAPRGGKEGNYIILTHINF